MWQWCDIDDDDDSNYTDDDIDNDIYIFNGDVSDDDCCFSVSHLERDLSQKRVLMDEIKLKLTAALENAETDASVMVL